MAAEVPFNRFRVKSEWKDVQRAKKATRIKSTNAERRSRAIFCLWSRGKHRRQTDRSSNRVRWEKSDFLRGPSIEQRKNRCVGFVSFECRRSNAFRTIFSVVFLRWFDRRKFSCSSTTSERKSPKNWLFDDLSVESRKKIPIRKKWSFSFCVDRKRIAKRDTENKKKALFMTETWFSTMRIHFVSNNSSLPLPLESLPPRKSIKTSIHRNTTWKQSPMKFSNNRSVPDDNFHGSVLTLKYCSLVGTFQVKEPADESKSKDSSFSRALFIQLPEEIRSINPLSLAYCSHLSSSSGDVNHRSLPSTSSSFRKSVYSW